MDGGVGWRSKIQLMEIGDIRRRQSNVSRGLLGGLGGGGEVGRQERRPRGLGGSVDARLAHREDQQEHDLGHRDHEVVQHGEDVVDDRVHEVRGVVHGGEA